MRRALLALALTLGCSSAPSVELPPACSTFGPGIQFEACTACSCQPLFICIPCISGGHVDCAKLDPRCSSEPGATCEAAPVCWPKTDPAIGGHPPDGFDGG